MRQRVIIENVKPQVNAGRYPVKRVVGEPINLSADIFADGHDAVRAAVQYKKAGAKSWKESPMIETGNDTFAGTFSLEEEGQYQYRIIGWVDHLQNWYNGFLKKQAVGQHLSLELEEGVIILEKAATTYPKSKAKDLLAVAKRLEDKKGYQESIQIVLSPEFKELVLDYPFKQFETASERILNLTVERKRALFSSWYEFFPRSAPSDSGKHGTFKDAEKLIPRVAELGFDIVYFPPIHPVGEINRKGKNNATTAQPGEPGSPWAIGSKEGGHKSVSSELGTMKDYEDLIKTANAHGIEVALDLAYQCAPDHPYVKEHPEWFVWRPDNTIMYAENPPKKYQDIVPLNFECEDWEGLWNELLSVIVFWVKKGVKVFRVDNPHTKSFNFWEWAIAETHKKYPEVIFLAEAFTRPKLMASLAKKGFTQGYSYFTWRVSKQELETYMTELTKTESREYYRPNFWPNTPDILPYHLQGANENAFVMRLLLAATLSSNYGVYGPAYEYLDNNGNSNGKEEYHDSEKYEIKNYDWNKRNRLTTAMIKINQLRNEHAALQSTWNITFTSTNNDNIMSYVKRDPSGNTIWCIVNLDPYNAQAAFVEVPKQLFGIDRVNLRLHDLLTDQYFDWRNDWNYIELNPSYYPMHILRVQSNH